MIRSDRSYAEYEELEILFKAAKELLYAGDYTQAAEALKRLYSQAVLMWGPAPMTASEVGTLWGDVRERRAHPPYGDFSKRLEERRKDFAFEYDRDLRKAEAMGKDFVPAGKPALPHFLAPAFTDEQLRLMVEAIHAQEGHWGNIDAESEIVRIGCHLGLDEDQSLELFKQTVEEGYIYPGRVMQVPNSAQHKNQVVGFGKINVAVSEGMKLTTSGRALIAG